MAQNKQVAPRDEQKIRKDERKKVRKKKRAKGTLLTAIAAFIAYLIMSFNGFFGLGPSEPGDGNGTSVESTVSEEGASVENGSQSSEVGEDKRIIVDEAAYRYGDVVYDLEGIKVIVQDMDTQGLRLDIVDKFANSQTFDELESFLKEEGVEYNVVEDYE